MMAKVMLDIRKHPGDAYDLSMAAKLARGRCIDAGLIRRRPRPRACTNGSYLITPAGRAALRLHGQS
jgi:hypothetical protein